MSQSDMIGRETRMHPDGTKDNRIEWLAAVTELTPCAGFSLERVLDQARQPAGGRQ